MLEVKGNGNIISTEKQVSSFLRLDVGSKGIVELIQSNEEKVVIEADENLMSHFDITNSGRTLYVSSEAKIRTPQFTSCRVKVYFRQLDTLAIRCDGGDVICPDVINLTNPLEIKIQSVGNTSLNINAPSIKLLSQCEGNVSIKGTCNSIIIKDQSEGDFNSKELMADDLTIKNMSEGNIEVYASKNISITHYGQGYIHYYGDAVLNNVKQYGDGQIKHMD